MLRRIKRILTIDQTKSIFLQEENKLEVQKQKTSTNAKRQTQEKNSKLNSRASSIPNTTKTLYTTLRLTPLTV